MFIVFWETETELNKVGQANALREAIKQGRENRPDNAKIVITDRYYNEVYKERQAV